jgi:hypothetical protein
MCYACIKQQTNKQTKEDEKEKKEKKEKEKRITCAEQDSMKVKRGVKMYNV